MSKKYIFANWKANKDYHQAKSWLKEFSQFLASKQLNFKLNKGNLEIILAPNFSLLWPVSASLHSSNLALSLAIQDLSHQPAGSFTGSVAASNLRGLAVKYAILGHSERRRYFADTDEIVAAKVKLALKAGFIPVVCLDEAYIESQASFLDQELRTKCLVAYEPWQAISTATNNSQSAAVEQISPVIAKIKAVFKPKAVIYGGSVDQNNINQYLAVTDGALIGGASLEAKQFAEVVANAQV